MGLRVCSLSAREHGSPAREAERDVRVNRKALRESWTAYAQQQGLDRSVWADTGTAREGAALPSRNKYGAKRTQVDGIWFASKKEAARYETLKLRQMAGAISNLECQPVFPLHVMRLAYNEVPVRVITVGKFTADFSYLDEQSGEYVIEDVKGFRKGEAYRLRKKVVEAVHGIVITEV